MRLPWATKASSLPAWIWPQRVTISGSECS